MNSLDSTYMFVAKMVMNIKYKYIDKHFVEPNAHIRIRIRLCSKGKSNSFFFPSKIFFNSIKKKTPEVYNLNLFAQKLTTFYVQSCMVILWPKIGLCRRCRNLLMHTAMIYWYSRKGPWKSIVSLRPLRPLSWLTKQGQHFP